MFLVMLCAGSTLLLVQSKALDEAPYKLSEAVAKLTSINLLKFGFLLTPTGSINLGFTTEERLDVVLIIPSSWGSQRGVIYTPSA
jgi:hypothetical protein